MEDHVFPPSRSYRLLSWPGRVINSTAVSDQEDEIKIKGLLSRMDEWDFDVFQLQELTKGRVLEELGYAIFEKMGWMAKFHIDVITLRTFLKVLAHGYRADNPFHNAVHAADVTQAVYYFINSPGLRDRLTDVEKFTAVIAAVIHDVDHPGLNNAFLEKSNDLINLIHGSSGTLERHHLTAGLDVLFRCDLLKQMTPEDREHVCSLVKELVLATDMARHGEFMEKFNGLHTNGVDWSNSETRTLILQLVMKCADINNSARPQRCMETWAAMVMTEFFNQGDQEKGLQIEVSKGFDRETTSIPTVQAGFIGFCVQPLFQALANLVPCDATQLTLALLSENLARWKERQAEVAAQKAADNA